MTGYELKKSILKEELLGKFHVLAFNPIDGKFFEIGDSDPISWASIGFELVLQATELLLNIEELKTKKSMLVNVVLSSESSTTTKRIDFIRLGIDNGCKQCMI